MQRSGYLSVKQASERYGVSRAKIHRLIKAGRLSASKDPRDERVTLLSTEELDRLFDFSLDEESGDGFISTSQTQGRLTPDLRERLDKVRLRISGGKPLPGDSTDLIRQERNKRAKQIEETVFKIEEE